MSYYRMKLKNIMKSFIISSITINSNRGYPEHLQSFFISIKNKVFINKIFCDFLSSVKK